MINKMKLRKGGYRRGVSNSAKYLLKTNPQGDAIDCSIERLEGESDQAYANRIEKIFESARVPNQQNLYQFNSLSLHPSEGEKFTDAQMIEMAKEVYLRNGVKNGLTENRHTMFVVERNTKHHHVHAMIHLTDLETKKVNNKMIDYNPIIKKLELKYGLYNEHRKPKDEDEYKKTFKKELKAILDNALTASEFLLLADAAGFEITHSGKDAYSMTKDGQKFKASDLGMSYKTLKARLGDDPEFAATLALLHAKNPHNDGSGSITTPFSEAPTTEAPSDEIPASKTPVNQSPATEAPAKQATGHDADNDDYADAEWCEKYAAQQRAEKREKYADYYDNKDFEKYQHFQKTLYANFHSDDEGNYYHNKDGEFAFEFDAASQTVSHKRSSPRTVRAGLQKLTENKIPNVYVTGGERYRRETWMQFHLMNLGDKGFTLHGFKPSKKDLEALETKRLEQQNRSVPKVEDTIKSLPTEKPVQPLPIKSSEKPIVTLAAKAAETSPATDKPTLADTAGSVKDGGMKAASKVVAVAAGVLDGALQKISDPTDS